MSTGDDHSHWRDGIAAYLLGALEPAETAALERHLAECAACREELRWLTPASQMLPESVERVEAPEALRERILAEVRADAAAAASPTRRRRPRFALRPALALAAVLLVAVVGVLALRDGGGGSSPGTPAAGAVSATVERNGEQGILHLANLRSLPPDRVYEAWVQRDSRVTSAHALFEPNPDGTATAVIGDMNGVEAVMVTAEPRGGTTQPTSKPVLSLSMSAE
ncbi:MAG TPA: anti-sigma factor [Solirubrobacterales bacterium]|nr:anti-sigma factor [Solirubrobacterales bacterium]